MKIIFIFLFLTISILSWADSDSNETNQPFSLNNNNSIFKQLLKLYDAGQKPYFTDLEGTSLSGLSVGRTYFLSEPNSANAALLFCKFYGDRAPDLLPTPYGCFKNGVMNSPTYWDGSVERYYYNQASSEAENTYINIQTAKKEICYETKNQHYSSEKFHGIICVRKYNKYLIFKRISTQDGPHFSKVVEVGYFFKKGLVGD